MVSTPSHMNVPKTETHMWGSAATSPRKPTSRGSSAQPPSTHTSELLTLPSRRDILFLIPLQHTMSLLTPSESRAFQSFLDATAFPVDWSMQLEISHEHMPPARGREALTKATKDLMSLDAEKWWRPPSSSSSSSRQSPVDPSASSSSSAKLHSSGKRYPPPDAKLSNKRQRPSTSSQNLPDEAQFMPQNRSALLSPSQKKANHIQSEQKRRANIRRGYDALCETVPTLREACQAEDEQQLADGKSKSRRRGKGRAKPDDGERVDGRAGPRSENIVLSKTIDYLHELLSEREILVQRLHAARNALPLGHPLLRPDPDAPIPLWERKWSGGEEKGNDDDDDDDDD